MWREGEGGRVLMLLVLVVEVVGVVCLFEVLFVK